MFNLKEPAKKISLAFFAAMFVVGMVIIIVAMCGGGSDWIAASFKTVADALYPYWTIIALGVAVTGAGSSIAGAIGYFKNGGGDNEKVPKDEMYGD